MELRRFPGLTEAKAHYQRLATERRDAVASLFIALCHGEDERAETMYRQVTFPGRWWADLAYMQGHYLIRLRRRDRLIALASDLEVGAHRWPKTENPWSDLESIAQHIDLQAQAVSATDGARESRVRCLLGHAYLAMDFHEWAVASYRAALDLDGAVCLPWENPRLLEFERQRHPGNGGGKRSNEPAGVA